MNQDIYTSRWNRQGNLSRGLVDFSKVGCKIQGQFGVVGVDRNLSLNKESKSKIIA